MNPFEIISSEEIQNLEEQIRVEKNRRAKIKRNETIREMRKIAKSYGFSLKELFPKKKIVPWKEPFSVPKSKDSKKWK